MEPQLSTILYAEDDQDIRSIVEMTLRNFSDFKLISCNDGREALELAEDITPDMVLLDVMMPNVDGLTVLNRLKELDAYRRVPIVLMTAKVQKHEVEQFKELGATDVIIKPFDPLTLVDRIVDIWNEYHGCS
ncbi:response regulator [Endozoicomonas atrinae]|uniref:response regulator n=1 Tax=Endozoicomonas atrinae TaxID=1333660 RepID=UPI000825A950|nr:response regulator [Endozoicomonas atrinae]